MNLACPVASCVQPRRATENICGACASDLIRALKSVPWLAAELLTTMARQTPRTGGGSERPLPYDVRASEAAGLLRVVLVGWVRDLGDDPDVGNGLADMGRWLLERHQRLVRHAAAQELCEEICDAVRRAEKAIDRPGERTYAGPCNECRKDLYAKLGAVLVRCKGCGWECGIAERKEWLLEQLQDRLTHATDAAHIVSTLLGVDLPASRIWKWAQRGRIVEHGTDISGRPLYRIGEVREKVIESARHDAERKTKREAVAPQVKAMSG